MTFTNSGRWWWRCLPLSEVDLEAVDAGLCREGVPALVATSHDDAFWTLRLYGAGELCHGAVFFHETLDGDAWLDVVEEHCDSIGDVLALYDDPRAAPFQPDVAMGELEGLPVTLAARELIEAVASRTAEELVRLGMVDRAELVEEILDGRVATPGEALWQTGIMPRFLERLGIPVFPSWQRQLADFVRSWKDREVESEGRLWSDLVEPILDIHEDLPGVDLGGEPLRLPVDSLSTLWLLCWCCCPTLEALLIVPSRPRGEADWPELLGEPLDRGERSRGRSEHTIFPISGRPPAEVLGWLDGIARVLRTCDGGAVALLTAAEDAPMGSLCTQRFSGAVTDGRWTIDDALLHATADELGEALALLEALKDGRSPDLETGERDLLLRLQPLSPRQKVPEDGAGGQVEGRFEVARALILHRYGDRWRRRALLAMREQGIFGPGWEADLARTLHRTLGEGPAAGVLLEGRAGTHYEINLAAAAELLGGLRSVFRAREGLLDGATDEATAGAVGLDVSDVDAAYAELGYHPLGDLVCDAAPDALLRAYARPAGGLAYGVLHHTLAGHTMAQFHTRFAGEASLTTGVDPGESRPDVGAYRVALPGGTVAQLHERHHEEVRRLQGQGLVPLAASPTLAGFAEAVDEFLWRLGRRSAVR